MASVPPRPTDSAVAAGSVWSDTTTVLVLYVGFTTAVIGLLRTSPAELQMASQTLRKGESRSAMGSQAKPAMMDTEAMRTVIAIVVANQRLEVGLGDSGLIGWHRCARPVRTCPTGTSDGKSGSRS